jgi:hypothetical protein
MPVRTQQFYSSSSSSSSSEDHLTVEQLTALRRMHPEVPDRVWDEVHSEALDRARNWLRHRLTGRLDLARAAGGAIDATCTWGRGGAAKVGGGARNRRNVVKYQNYGPVSESTMETLRALAPGEAQKAALKATYESSKLSAAEKIDALKQIDEQFEELHATRRKLQEDLMSSSTNMTRSRFQQTWAALEKLSAVILLVFRGLWTQIWDFVSALLSNSNVDKEAEKEISESMKAGKPWYNRIWEGVRTVISYAWSGVWTSMRFLWSGLKMIFGHGFNLVTSVMASPNTARMSLLMANFIKRGLCRQIITWYMSTFEERTKQNIDESFMDAGAFASMFTGPIVTQAAGKVVQQGGIQKITGLAKGALKVGFSLIPVVGPVLGAVSDLMVDAMGEASAEAAAMILHYSAVTKAFTAVVDLLDPRSCIDEMRRRRDQLVGILGRPAGDFLSLLGESVNLPEPPLANDADIETV